MTRMATAFALVLAAAVSLSFFGCSKGEDHAGEMMEERHEGMEEGHGMAGGESGEMGGGMGMDEHSAQMARQHESMMGMQEEWSKAKGGIEKGDVQAVVKSAGEMAGQSGSLEGFMLHKNPEGREEFLKKATEFRSLIMEFKGYAEKNDVKSLKEVAPRIDAACNGCHQAFK